MDVQIKKFIVQMEIKTSGIELGVNKDGKQIGDLVVTKTGLVWCKGKTTKKNGCNISWQKFIAFMEELQQQQQKKKKKKK